MLDIEISDRKMCRLKRVLIKSFSVEDASLFRRLKKEIERELSIECEYIGDQPIPFASYNTLRKQFLAEKFLETLLIEKDFEEDIVLGICDVDLYEPGLNFVFGMASPFYHVAVVSTKRLRESFYGRTCNEDLFFSRVLSESVHEIGHTLGLEHCSTHPCVMNFSNSIEETDDKGFRFCSSCKSKMERILCLYQN